MRGPRSEGARDIASRIGRQVAHDRLCVVRDPALMSMGQAEMGRRGGDLNKTISKIRWPRQEGLAPAIPVHAARRTPAQARALAAEPLPVGLVDPVDPGLGPGPGPGPSLSPSLRINPSLGLGLSLIPSVSQAGRSEMAHHRREFVSHVNLVLDMADRLKHVEPVVGGHHGQ